MGSIILYTGNGGGKTIASLGLAMRAVGHKQRVVIIQFMKGWKNVGEFKIQRRLKPNYEIYQFGRPSFVNPKKVEKLDAELAEKGLKFARKILKQRKKPSLLILDELNIAVAFKLLKLGEVLKFLGKIPKRTNIVLTGRYAPRKLINFADYAIELKDLRRPKKPMAARAGIEY